MPRWMALGPVLVVHVHAPSTTSVGPLRGDISLNQGKAACELDSGELAHAKSTMAGGQRLVVIPTRRASRFSVQL